MEMELERKEIHCLRQRVRQVQNQEQTLEVRLPEGYPDVAGIICAWGQCLLRSKEWRTDHVGVSGGVVAWVLYRPADGTAPRWVEAWLPFQMKCELVESVREGTVRALWRLKGVDGRMLSARKILVRAAVGVLVEALEPAEAEIAAAVDLPEDVQVLKRSYPAVVPREAGEKTFLVDEELPFLEEAGWKIVACMGTPVLTEQTVAGSRCVFRGVVRIHMLLQNEEGLLRSMDVEPEFSQFADLDGDYEQDASLTVMAAVSSLEPEIQENRLRIKCGIVAQYAVCDRVLLEVVEDAYSPLRDVVPRQEMLDVPMVLEKREQSILAQTHTVTEPEQTVDISVWMEHPQVRRAGSLTEMEVPGAVQMLYYDSHGQLQAETARFRGTWECPADPDVLLQGEVLPAPEPQMMPGDGGIEVVQQIPLDVTVWNQQGVPMVTGVSLGEPVDADPDRPSLILCRRDGRSLWELAKYTGSTVEKICQANGLAGEPLDDRLLLIPVL